MSDKTGLDIGKGVAGLQAAADTARQAGAQAKQAGTEAFGHAQDVAQEAKGRATDLAGEVKQQAAAAATTQKDGLADRLEDVAKAVHRSGEQLEGHQDWIAGLVERGADELGALASTLRTNDLQSLLGEVGSLARRQPALFAGLSLAVGFALARIGRVAVAGASQADLPTMPGANSTLPMANPALPEANHERS